MARIERAASIKRGPCDCTPETCCCRQKNEVDKAEKKK